MSTANCELVLFFYILGLIGETIQYLDQLCMFRFIAEYSIRIAKSAASVQSAFGVSVEELGIGIEVDVQVEESRSTREEGRDHHKSDQRGWEKHWSLEMDKMEPKDGWMTSKNNLFFGPKSFNPSERIKNILEYKRKLGAMINWSPVGQLLSESSSEWWHNLTGMEGNCPLPGWPIPLFLSARFRGLWPPKSPCFYLTKKTLVILERDGLMLVFKIKIAILWLFYADYIS